MIKDGTEELVELVCHWGVEIYFQNKICTIRTNLPYIL